LYLYGHKQRYIRTVITFNKRVLLFGFGSIGRSLYSIMHNEIKFDFNNFFVLDENDIYIEEFVKLGGLRENFIKKQVTRENYAEIFASLLKPGDLLIDLSANTGSTLFVGWCAENNVCLINSGDSDWDDSRWRTLKEHYNEQAELIEKLGDAITAPIVIQHGMNPGLVSHFAIEALIYVTETQKSDDAVAQEMLAKKDFAHLAEHLGVRTIQISENDLQTVDIPNPDPDCLYNTWSPLSLFEENFAPAEFMAGTNESSATIPDLKELDGDRFALMNKTGFEALCKSWCPNGSFSGGTVQHDEATSIQKFLSVYNQDTIRYAPTVMFVYRPLAIAREYMEDFSRHNHGERQPKRTKVVYEELTGGIQYVGVFVIGEKFKPVWVGNAITLADALKWGPMNVPTILQVSAGVLGALCWIMKNQERGKILYPEFLDHRFILDVAEKYITKTKYITVEDWPFGFSMISLLEL